MDQPEHARHEVSEPEQLDGLKRPIEMKPSLCGNANWLPFNYFHSDSRADRIIFYTMKALSPSDKVLVRESRS